MNKVQVEVTGWDADGESVSWDGYGDTEDAATDDAIARGGIVEVGEARLVGVVYWEGGRS